MSFTYEIREGYKLFEMNGIAKGSLKLLSAGATKVQLVVFFYIRLDRDRQVRVHRCDLPVRVGTKEGTVDSSCGHVASATRGARSTLHTSKITSSTASVGDPVDSDGVQGYISSARSQADQTSLVALEVDQGKNIGRTENQSHDAAQQRPAGDITKFAFGRALEQGGG